MEMVVGSVKMDGLGWGEMEPAEGNAAGWAGSGNPLCNVPLFKSDVVHCKYW